MKWIILTIIGFIFCVGINTIMNNMENAYKRACQRRYERQQKQRLEELCKRAVPDYEARTREERIRVKRIIKNTISWGKELDRIYGKRERRRRKAV